jgi:ribonucleotide monophosphatase NagD (HAD superfamily)
VQVASDVILAGGIIGGPYDYELKQKVDLVFCNPDLIWKSEFPQPRFGQGAFKIAFQAVFKVCSISNFLNSYSPLDKSLTGKECPYVQYGKPTKATYDFAKELLDHHSKDLHGPDSCPIPQMWVFISILVDQRK